MVRKFEGASPQDACKPYIESSGMVYDGVQFTGGTPVSCKGHRLPSTEVYSFGSLSKVTNPAYDPAAEPSEDDKKTIPLDTVAQQVITNAESATDPQKRLLLKLSLLVLPLILLPKPKQTVLKLAPLHNNWKHLLRQNPLMKLLLLKLIRQLEHKPKTLQNPKQKT